MLSKLKEFLKPTWQKGFLTLLGLIILLSNLIDNMYKNTKCDPTNCDYLNLFINNILSGEIVKHILELVVIYILVCLIIFLWNHFLGWKKPEFLPSEELLEKARKALKLETIQGIEPVKMEGPDNRTYWSFRYGAKEILIDEKTGKIVKKQV